MIHDAVYADSGVEALIKKQYPQAQTKDASDWIHTERFEVVIDDIEPKDFYTFAIKEGFALCCFGFQIRLLDKDTFPEVKEWVDAILKQEATP